MKKLLIILFFLPTLICAQTFYSSETRYLKPDKRTEAVKRTIKIERDTITIISKTEGYTDIQKLVINYSHEGKYKGLGKSMIYECTSATQPFMYDVAVPLKDKVKKIEVTEVDLIKKEWVDLYFLIE